MYVSYQVKRVSGHVYVFCQAMRVSGHVCVLPSQESERSCMCPTK